MDIGLSNLSLKFITLSFYSASHCLALISPSRTNSHASYVQILLANLRTSLRLSLPPRNILLAPRIRHHPHLRRSRTHGRQRNGLTLFRDADGILCVCIRRLTMESDADLAEK